MNRRPRGCRKRSREESGSPFLGEEEALRRPSKRVREGEGRSSNAHWRGSREKGALTRRSDFSGANPHNQNNGGRPRQVRHPQVQHGDRRNTSANTRSRSAKPRAAQPKQRQAPVKQGSHKHENTEADEKAKKREEDAHRVAQRRKQIERVKAQPMYRLYRDKVPKNRRTRQQPQTPPCDMKIAKRRWMGKVKVWQRGLHEVIASLGLQSELAAMKQRTALKCDRCEATFTSHEQWVAHRRNHDAEEEKSKLGIPGVAGAATQLEDEVRRGEVTYESDDMDLDALIDAEMNKENVDVPSETHTSIGALLADREEPILAEDNLNDDEFLLFLQS